MGRLIHYGYTVPFFRCFVIIVNRAKQDYSCIVVPAMVKLAHFLVNFVAQVLL